MNISAKNLDVIANTHAEVDIRKTISQTIHDIRSPLATLKVISSHLLTELEEEKRTLICNVVQRIEHIINDLADHQQTREAMATQPLAHLIEVIVAEKRVQYRARSQIRILADINQNTDALVKIQPNEFKRVLSNLVTNAVEAIDDDGTVTITLKTMNNLARIQVTDTGRGISSVILPKLMQRGATFGKSAGSGLGLYHARLTVESWGGSLLLESVEGKGTVATITVPCDIDNIGMVEQIGTILNT